eukprot:1535058-Pleurochrysis_carterae.AAC.2
MACETYRTFKRQQRRELRRYSSISQFLTTFPVGRLAATTCEVLGHNGQVAHQGYSPHPGSKCRAIT